MCNPASFEVHQSRGALWSEKSNDHMVIRAKHRIPECKDILLLESVPCELAPPDFDYRIPLERWEFRVDLKPDMIPEWYSEQWAEEQCRAVLPAWAEHHIIRDGEHTITNGMSRVVLGGTVNVAAGGWCQHVHDGTVNVMAGGWCWCVHGGIVNIAAGGECWSVDGGTVNIAKDGEYGYIHGGTVNVAKGGKRGRVHDGTVIQK